MCKRTTITIEGVLEKRWMEIRYVSPNKPHTNNID